MGRKSPKLSRSVKFSSSGNHIASVTIIIPAYNSVPFLEDTVKSALAQTDPPERIIIVDDGSPDESYALAQALASSHPSVQAVQRKNGGAGAARNTGVSLAKMVPV